jgi:hypothetical protein
MFFPSIDITAVRLVDVTCLYLCIASESSTSVIILSHSLPGRYRWSV